MFYTTPISAAVIYEPWKVSFCRMGCGCHLFNEVEGKDGGSARVQQDTGDSGVGAPKERALFCKPDGFY